MPVMLKSRPETDDEKQLRKARVARELALAGVTESLDADSAVEVHERAANPGDKLLHDKDKDQDLILEPLTPSASTTQTFLTTLQASPESSPAKTAADHIASLQEIPENPLPTHTVDGAGGAEVAATETETETSAPDPDIEEPPKSPEKTGSPGKKSPRKRRTKVAAKEEAAPVEEVVVPELMPEQRERRIALEITGADKHASEVAKAKADAAAEAAAEAAALAAAEAAKMKTSPEGIQAAEEAAAKAATDMEAFMALTAAPTDGGETPSGEKEKKGEGGEGRKTKRARKKRGTKVTKAEDKAEGEEDGEGDGSLSPTRPPNEKPSESTPLAARVVE